MRKPKELTHKEVAKIAVKELYCHTNGTPSFLSMILAQKIENAKDDHAVDRILIDARHGLYGTVRA